MPFVRENNFARREQGKVGAIYRLEYGRLSAFV